MDIDEDNMSCVHHRCRPHLDRLCGVGRRKDRGKFSARHCAEVSAHKDAVSLFERYANGGEDPKLKDWAGKTLPDLQHHLEMAQELEKNRK